MKQREEEKDEETKETRETKEGAIFFFFFFIEQKRSRAKGGRKLVRGRGGNSGTGKQEQERLSGVFVHDEVKEKRADVRRFAKERRQEKGKKRERIEKERETSGFGWQSPHLLQLSSAKVISFWCRLMAFDHACHVSKQ